MKYDLTNPLHRQQFATRAAHLTAQGTALVELREVRHQRSDRQNRYLHALIAYFALQVGEDRETVKREYYKFAANRELFAYEAESRVTHRRVLRLRSSASLTTEEMTLTIERFRSWAAQTAGIYLPAPEDEASLRAMEAEASRAAEWL